MASSSQREPLALVQGHQDPCEGTWTLVKKKKVVWCSLASPRCRGDLPIRRILGKPSYVVLLYTGFSPRETPIST